MTSSMVKREMVTLATAPSGRSLSDERAERSITWAETRMKFDVTNIERQAHSRAQKLNKEKIELLKDYTNIKTTTGNLKGAVRKVGVSKFLKDEKERLHKLIENKKSGSIQNDYRSDGNSSDASSEFSFDDDESLFSSNDFESALSSRRSSSSKKRQTKGSYEERSRDKRIENLQRRYSAQVHTEPIVNVNRRLKYHADKV